MTTTQYTAPVESADAAEARLDFFAAEFPYWEQAVNPERFVPESAFPVAPATVPNMPTTADWEAFAAANYSDPAELSY